jgi:UDPglucose 6-dehydrogenase
LISAVVSSNDKRKDQMVEKVSAILDGEVANKKIALFGLAFKANTDDIRYSPVITIAKKLAQKGGKIIAHDYEAIENSKRELVEFKNIEFCEDVYEAAKDADIIVIATEWKEYQKLDLSKIKTKKIADLRNLFDAKKMKDLGFEYHYVGGKE